jgi:hypothetical protein
MSSIDREDGWSRLNHRLRQAIGEHGVVREDSTPRRKSGAAAVSLEARSKRLRAIQHEDIPSGLHVNCQPRRNKNIQAHTAACVILGLDREERQHEHATERKALKHAEQLIERGGIWINHGDPRAGPPTCVGALAPLHSGALAGTLSI